MSRWTGVLRNALVSTLSGRSVDRRHLFPPLSETVDVALRRGALRRRRQPGGRGVQRPPDGEHILLVAVCDASLGVLFGPAETVAVRRVVAPDHMRQALAVNQSRQQLAGLLGPSISGALFGISRALPFLADALSYLESFVAVATLRTSLSSPGRGDPRQGLWAELFEGLRWLWKQPFLRAACLWLAAASLLFTSLGLVTLVLAIELGGSPAQIGLAFTITGAGGLVGALLSPQIVRRVSTPALLITYSWSARGQIRLGGFIVERSLCWARRARSECRVARRRLAGG